MAIPASVADPAPATACELTRTIDSETGCVVFVAVPPGPARPARARPVGSPDPW